MRPWHRMRVQQLRQILDFRKLPKPEDSTRGVVVEWPDPGTLLEGDPRWETFFQNTWYEEGGAQREWVLRRTVPKADGSFRKERLAVRIFVSSTGYACARRYFRRLLLSVTTETISERVEVVDDDPVIVSSLAAPISDGRGLHNDSFKLCFRNLTFDLRSYESDADLRGLAFKLLAIARARQDVPLRDHQPPLARPDLPPELPPGHEVTIELPAVPDPFGSFGGTGVAVLVQTRGEAAFSGFRDKGALFLLQNPGPGRIRVQAIDQRTLLSKEVALGVNVRVPESATSSDS
jgi:hypothetical protein